MSPCLNAKLAVQGTVNCNVCHVSYSTSIDKLSEEIDVYSEWIDQCEEANA